jgi:hypothetical protein
VGEDSDMKRAERRKYTLIDPSVEAKSVIVPFLNAGIEPILAAQGCTFMKGEKQWNGCIVIQYPAGSVRYEVFPRTLEIRFLVIFPDGFEVLEVENRNGECVALYIDAPVRNQDRP